ncbi:hypothetical protein CRUP_018769, partial [Coryphaenoides rupestris]
MKISTYNGQPLTLEDQAKTVWVDVDQGPLIVFWERGNVLDYGEGTRANQTTQYSIPADGVIPLLIYIHEDTSRLTIAASLEDTYEMLTLDSNYHSPSQSYLQIQKPTTPAQTSWAPLACVVVYCVLPSGEVVNDVLQLPVPLELQNKVSLTWSEEQRRPADQVSLWLTVSEPQSLVAILVVDTATQQRDSRNDITVERSCGLIVVTDAVLHPTTSRPPALELVLRNEVRPRQRRDFPETWLWMDINT